LFTRIVVCMIVPTSNTRKVSLKKPPPYKQMANAMLKHDEFPTSTSSVDWLSMCTSNSDSSMSNMNTNIVIPMQPPAPVPPPPPPPINCKPSYNTTIGITSPPLQPPITSILHSSSIYTTDDRTKEHRFLSSTITTGTSTNTMNTNNNSHHAMNTLSQRKSVDFATLPLPSPKRIRQQIISLSMYTNSNRPKWTTKQIIDGMLYIYFG
jgi:hypothetical protein